MGLRRNKRAAAKTGNRTYLQGGSHLKKEDFQLTTREKEILFPLADGLSYKKIADKYYLSVPAIRKHISNIYEKLHVHSKSQAVAGVLNSKNNK